MSSDMGTAVRPRVVMFTVMDFAFGSLAKELSRLNCDVLAVVTACGPRKRRSDAYLAVCAAANAAHIDVVISDHPKQYAHLLQPYLPFDMITCWGFPWLIPGDALSLPRLGALNMHNSLLPKHRGPNALGWLLRNGENQTALCVHRMEPQFDTGPILCSQIIPVGVDDMGADIIPRYVAASAPLWGVAVEKALQGVPGAAQVGEASEAPLFDDKYKTVNWDNDRLSIHNQVRAWYGVRDMQLGATAWLLGNTSDPIRITRTKMLWDDVSERVRDDLPVEQAPGTLLFKDNNRMIVQAGDGPLLIVNWMTEPIDQSPKPNN